LSRLSNALSNIVTVAVCINSTALPIFLKKESYMADISNYYKVISLEGNLFHVELDGFWSDEVMDRISTDMQKIFKDSVLSFGGKPIIHIAHWKTTPVFGRKATTHLTESMKFFKEHNGYKTIEIVPTTMVKVGLRNAAAEAGDDFRIQAKDIVEAMEIYKKLQQELLKA
jgi:hypothetical protein